ncbi:MAG: hypothetical protein EAZ89_07775, partial [Bacteroidetes bacterium]
MYRKRHALLALLFLLAANGLHAQIDTISGVINSYTRVSAVNPAGAVTVLQPSLFAIGDLALLIQMQGAQISTANSNTFGSISSLNGAGNYEFVSVCDVNTTTGEIQFENAVVNTYNPA